MFGNDIKGSVYFSVLIKISWITCAIFNGWMLFIIYCYIYVALTDGATLYLYQNMF